MLTAALGHDVSHAHVPEMKPEQKQEQEVTPQLVTAPEQPTASATMRKNLCGS